ncbi:DUF84 family protein [Patescibacteria group bacterium]|nr:DUF84 family protein [Patescibacteria group bacterium]
MTVSIVVGTLSELKLTAVRQACAERGLVAKVTGVAVESNVPQQPVGYIMTGQGALHRAQQAQRQRPNSFVVGIENGIIEQVGGWADLAVIRLILPGQSSSTHIFFTDPVDIPADVVEEVLRRGIDQVTIGQVLAKRHPNKCSPVDPHSFLTRGQHSRQEVLARGLWPLVDYITHWSDLSNKAK